MIMSVIIAASLFLSLISLQGLAFAPVVVPRKHVRPASFQCSPMKTLGVMVPSQQLFLSSTTNQVETKLEAITEIKAAVTKPNIQRYYETYRWRDTYNINYRVEGENKLETNTTPVLLIHGFGANVNHFRFQFPDLVQAGYKVYAIDLLGFGGSDKPGDFDYCIEEFAQLCVDFVTDMCESQPWVLCGNSIGGLCSLLSAEMLLGEDKVKGCVLFNCAGGMSGFRYDDVPIYIKPVLWFVQTIVLGPGFGGRFFENFKTRDNVESILKQQGVYGDVTNVDEDLLQILLEPGDDEGAKEVFLKVFGGSPGPTPESILPRLSSIPILALWGGADPWTPVDKGMHPGIHFGEYHDGNFKLEILPGVGHCPHDEAPTLVNKKMIDWMKDLH